MSNSMVCSFYGLHSLGMGEEKMARIGGEADDKHVGNVFLRGTVHINV